MGDGAMVATTKAVRIRASPELVPSGVPDNVGCGVLGSALTRDET